MGNNLGKTSDGKQQKQRNPKQKGILQGSGKESFANIRFSFICLNPIAKFMFQIFRMQCLL